MAAKGPTPGLLPSSLKCSTEVTQDVTQDSPMSLYHVRSFWLAVLTLVQIGCANAQPVLAYVSAKNANPERLQVFKTALAERGYTEGQNIRIEYREAVLDADNDGILATWSRRIADNILDSNETAT